MKLRNRVFVTGSRGKVGCKLGLELKKRGYEMVTLNTDINEVFEIKDCDFVIHLAAYQNIKYKKYDEFERVNVLGTKTLIEASLKAKIKKFVYVSTVMVFKDSGGTLRDEKWGKKKEGNNFYEESKIRALEVVNKYSEKLPIVTVYPTIVVDKEDFDKFKFPGWLMCRLGSMDRVLNFIDNKVLAKALVNLLEKQTDEEYILGGENISTGEYLKKIHNYKKWLYIPWFVPGLKLPSICFSNKKAVKDLIIPNNKLDIFS